VKRFQLHYQVTVVLDASQIWPDGDAPANPTAADVEALIKKCGGWATIVADWNLDEDAFGTVTEARS
jgi:hypothetical protein